MTTGDIGLMDGAAGQPQPSEVGRNGSRRADLQGLRAVAVLAVVAYHFGVPGVPGGFVGVDIFFVLSGFFITRLLMRDLEAHGHIRFGRFWANRVKRLLPNGLLTILCVLAASALLLPSYRLRGISDDAFSAAAFFANFHFAARAIDYFHLDDPTSPLLHYWSLAVEEQFYLALPLLMAGIGGFTLMGKRKAVLILLGIVAIASFSASLLAIESSQPEAFFHPQYRAWQLAIGGLTGLTVDRRTMVPPAIRAMGALLGALAVVAGIVLLDDNLAYPGLWALAPTLGTAALVFGVDAGHVAAPIARLLETPAMVAIGDMSYSLYLWHWPVAVFSATLWPAATVATVLAGLAVTGLLASAAYLLVERPLHRVPLPARGSLRVLAGGVGGIALAAGAAMAAAALPGQSDPAITALIEEATADLGPNYENGCHLGFDVVDQPDCRFGTMGGPRVVLFGDSHAAQWFTALVRAGQETGWEVNAWTKTSCPSVDVTIWYPPTRSVYGACGKWREDRLRELRADPPELVILANSDDYHGWIYDEVRQVAADRSTADALWKEAVSHVVNELTGVGVPVVMLRDTPRMYASYKDCLSVGEWADCGRTRGEALAGMSPVKVEAQRYSLLDLSDALCTPHECPAAANGRILYRDSDHLTATYAASLYGHFLELLANGGAIPTRSPRCGVREGPA